MTIFLKTAAAAAMVSTMGFGAAFAQSATPSNDPSAASPPPTVSQSPSATTPLQNLEVSPGDARRLFDTIDTNNDSTVTKKEWAAWQEIDMGAADRGKPLARGDVPVFQNYDLDANGELDQSEFVRAALLRDERPQPMGEGGSMGNPSSGGASGGQGTGVN